MIPHHCQHSWLLLYGAPVEEKRGRRQSDPDADHGEHDQEQRVIRLKIKCHDDHNEKRVNEQADLRLVRSRPVTAIRAVVLIRPITDIQRLT